MFAFNTSFYILEKKKKKNMASLFKESHWSRINNITNSVVFVLFRRLFILKVIFFVTVLYEKEG